MITLLQAIWDDFDRAWNSYDARALSECFADGCHFQFLDGRRFTGRSAIETFYREVFAKLPPGLIHRATIETERESSGCGLVQIINTADNHDVLRCRYEISISHDGFILALSLNAQPSEQR